MEHQNILVAECVFAELLQGAKNKKESNLITHYWLNLPKRNEAGLWIDAGIYAAEHKLSAKRVGLIDAFLIVLARKSGATLWTLDKKLKSLLNPSEIFLGN